MIPPPKTEPQPRVEAVALIITIYLNTDLAI